MRIICNGDEREVPVGTTVYRLLESLRLEGQPCAVEVNRELVPRARHTGCELADGDRVEIVTLVGGG